MKNGLKIVMVGAPGSGKGTQSVKIAEKFSILHISTGDIFRACVASQHPLGKLIESYISKGKLVPDDCVIEMVKDRLAQDDCKNGFILDGFPRSVYQAEKLEEITHVDCVIDLEVDEAILMERLCGRRSCKQCRHISHVSLLNGSTTCPVCGGELYLRDDDKPDTIHHRMQVYEEETKPIVEFFEKKGTLVHINSNQSPEQVFADIVEALKTIC